MVVVLDVLLSQAGLPSTYPQKPTKDWVLISLKPDCTVLLAFFSTSWANTSWMTD